MKTALLICLAVYIIGLPLTFWAQAATPVTPGLALLRTAVWPIYLATGWPKGVRQRPGDQYD